MNRDRHCDVPLTTPSYVRARVAGLAAVTAWAAALTFAAAPVAQATQTAPLRPLTDAASLTAGKAIFENPRSLCMTCHRPDLGGVVGPDLTDDQWLHGCSVPDIIASIKTGFPQRGMLPYGGGAALNDTQLHQVASYILSKRGSKPVKPKAPDPTRDKACK